MAYWEFNGKKPVAGKTSWIHETAQLIGDVIVGEQCFIGSGAVLRGDFGAIRVGNGSSIQESCALHCRPSAMCVVGNNVTVGHGSVLHGCEIKDRSVVGMGSVVSDGAVVGEDCIIREASFVKGNQTIPPGMLVSGNPAVVKGPLKDTQIMMKNAGYKGYMELAGMYLKTAKKMDK
jgi:carbonic anhydrase/acetyltransferase-like protein (isoleucine patch superfamily)